MNLVIIEADNNSSIKKEKLEIPKGMLKVNDEYLTGRIIRIGRINGIKRIFCVLNSHAPEFKQFLLENSFGIPLKPLEQDLANTIHSLFVMAPDLTKESFFLVNSNSVFLERELSEFITYSLLQEDSDGVVAVTRHINDEKPLGVAMNDEDIILKFNDTKDGYSWFNGGIYYFSPQILKEINLALQAGISELGKFLHLLIVRGYILKGFSFSKIVNVENESDIIEAENLIKLNE